MGSLDFAFLAEYAKAEASGTLTAVGAGLFGLLVTNPNAPIAIYVAGRVRQQSNTSDVLEVTIESPNREYSVEQSAEVFAPPVAPNGDLEATTTVFAVQVPVPFAGEGRYVIKVALGGADPLDVDLWIKLADPYLVTVQEPDEEASAPRSGE